jgi:RHS repeat-associated protein
MFLDRFLRQVVDRAQASRRSGKVRRRPRLLWVEPLEERIVLTDWSGAIPDGTVWDNTQVQHIVGNIDVPSGAKLTIKPGTHVEFDNGKGLQMNVEGTILAQGTAASPILLTSVRDGSGATNGDWNDLQFNAGSTGSILDHVEVRYGGNGTSAVYVNGGAQLTLSNSLVENSAHIGLRIEGSSPSVTGDTFQNNTGAAVSMDIVASPGISGSTATHNALNGAAIDSGTITTDTTWHSTGFVYALSDVTVATGVSLTLAAGQLVKVAPGFHGFEIHGTLNASGTAASPVVLTSLLDDSAASGGDTNNDGTATKPAAGDWNGVYYDTGSGGTLDHVVVRYGGSDQAGDIQVHDANLTLTNSTLSDSSQAGLRLDASSPTVTGDTFQNNGGAAVSMNAASNPAITGSTATKNSLNAVVIDTDTIQVSTAWNSSGIVYEIKNLSVAAGATLTIPAGLVVKFAPGDILDVSGTLVVNGTVAQPVRFTSIKDDTVGGDTNNDGGTTTAKAGDWDGVYFETASTGDVLDHVVVRYGGSDQAGNIEVHSPDLTLTNSVLSDGSSAGLRLVGSHPTVTGDTFQNNGGAAVSMDAASNPAITGSTVKNNQINAVSVDTDTIRANTAWNSSGIVYEIKGLTVAAGATLTMPAGLVVKFAQGDSLDVNGTLVVNGTAAQPVRFTSLKDDTVGGDTNNDQGATTPGAGDWSGLFFHSGSTGSVLDNVDVRYGGSDPFIAVGEVQLDHAGLTLSNSTLEDSDLGGLGLTASSPTLLNNTFRDNFGAAIHMDPASSPIIHGSTLTNNEINGVSIDDGTITTDTTWDNPDIVYELRQNLTVAAGVTLTIGPGQIIKAATDEFAVDGTLHATGTADQPVVFTSLKDDAAGGDTNNDQGATSPAAGDWIGLFFDSGSSGSLLDHVDFRYGGADPFIADGEIQANNASLTLSNSTIEHSSLGGLGVQGGSTTLSSLTIRDNAGAAIHIDPTVNLVSSGTTATGNGTDGIVVVGGTLSGNLAWTAQDLPYLLSSGVSVPQGDTLTLGPGALLVNGPNSSFSGGGTIASAGTFRVAVQNGSLDVNPSFVDTGTLQVESGTLSLHGGLTVNGSGTIQGSATATLRIDTNLGGNTTNAAQFAPLSTVNFDGSGSAGTPQTLEVMGKDQGNVAAGFSGNFTYGNLTVSNSTYVRLVDTVHNTAGGAAEALYADNLVVTSGSTLDLNGLHVYARVAELDGTVVGGTVTPLPSGGALALDTPAAGTLAAGAVDDWTFFAPASEAITVTVSTGSASTIPPLAPSVDYAQVTVLDGGTTLGTASNTQTGAEVTLAAIVPDNGFLHSQLVKMYHVHVQAPAAQASAAGHYVITAWDATPRTASLTLNQTTSGTIDTPFRADHWTFTASKGQLVQFQLVNVADPGVVFDLTGPNGYTAFSGATASSGPISLPSAGTYQVTVRGTNNRTGAYAFQLADSTIKALALGTPLTEAIAGTGQSHLFQLTITQPGQVRIALQDGNAADENELYVDYGAVPTRAKYHPWSYTGSSADKERTIPTAAPGTYFILVYNYFAAGPGNFTLTATESSVFVTAASPNRSGTAVDTTLTLTGAGFDSSAAVSLVSGGNSYPAAAVNVVSPTQLTATFPAGRVPAGTYAAQVSETGGATSQLASAVTIDQGGQANFSADVILPNSIGYHIPATIYIEYRNTGDVAMPAPLLFFQPTQTHADGTTTAGAFLTLDPSAVTQGFWTSALPRGFTHSLEFLASGATPGILGPGESERVAVYYAGWQQPWDGSYPPFSYQLAAVDADNPASLDWNSLEQSLPAPGIDPSALSAVYANVVAQTGPTWGDFVRTLDNDAIYLGQLGQPVSTLADLWGFAIAQANGLGPSTLTTADDLSVSAPGLSLSIARSINSTVTGHYVFGPFGYGWTLADGWGATLTAAADGTVLIDDTDGAERVFQPDSRAGGAYFTAAGDHGVLANLGGGTYTVTETDGQVTTFQNGRIASVQDADGNRITAGYTGSQLTSLTSTSGAFIHLAYNAAGLISKLTSSTGQTATYAYDATNRFLVSVSDGQGFHTGYSYSADSNPAVTNALVKVAYPDSTEDDFSYDAQGRLQQASAKGGAEAVSYSYGTGTVSATDANGGTTTLSFDQLGRLAKIVDPFQNATLFTYDPSGNLVQSTDAAGQVDAFAYDAQGNVVQSTDPLGQVTRYTYGPLGTITSIIDPKGNTTHYQYDAHGNPILVTSADGSTTSADYDATGQLQHATDADGHTTAYTSNAAGQPLTVTFADNSKITYTYDAHGNLTSAADASGTTTLTYDGADQLAKVAYPDGTFLKYTYDSAGRRIQMADQTGYTVNYTYNALGQLSGLTDSSGKPIVTYTYDAAGNLAKQVSADGSSTLYTYDHGGRILSMTNKDGSGAVVSSFTDTYDALGRRATETTLDGQWTYSYDAVGQLTHAVFASTNPAVPSQDLRYAYDAAGNRTSTVLNGVTTNYVTNNLNQYTSVGTASFVYDAAGNLIRETDGGGGTGGGTTTYSYDVAGRLVGVTAPGHSQTYGYDALGNRVTFTDNGQTTRALIDPAGLGDVVGQFDGAGNLLAHYTYGLGLVSRQDAAGVQAFYQFDLSSNTADLTVGGAVASTYRYLPFGSILTSSGSVANPFQFGGRLGVITASGGPVFMRARSYDPALGRFEQTDPIGVAGGLNLYAFAQNDPIDRSDPSGLISFAEEVAVLEKLRELYESFTGHSIPPWVFQNGVKGIFNTLLYLGVDLKEIAKIPGIQKVLGAEILAAARQIPVRLGPLVTRGVFARIGGAVAKTLGVVGTAITVAQVSYAAGTKINEHLENDTKEIIGDTVYESGNSVKRLWQFITGQKLTFSRDPNAAIGPDGFGDAHFIADAGEPLPYTIDFENAASATAPAQVVTVSDQLDPGLDLSTFQFTQVGFGDTVITVPAGSGPFFQTTVPMTEGGEMFNVVIQLALDLATGTISASFQSLNPQTGLPPGAGAGFLPPEDGTGRGQGFFSYEIAPMPLLTTGTQLHNVAAVTFDTNAPIATDQVDDEDPSKGNDPARQDPLTIDAGLPTSHVAPLPADSVPTFTVSWSGEDDAGGSGVGTYDVFVAIDGGPWTTWLTATPLTSAVYPGELGRQYAFYSIAIDNVANRENKSPVIEAQTQTPIVQSTLTEPAAGSAPSQESIDTLLGTHFSDADPNAQRGIAVTAVSGTGTWQYSTNGKKWHDITDVSQTSALLLPAADQLRFLPAALGNGDATLLYLAWDGSLGKAGGRGDAMVVGGGTAFSANAGVLDVTLTATAHAPSWTAPSTTLAPVLPGDANPAGQTVQQAFGGVFAAYNGEPAGVAVAGLTVPRGAGAWQFSTDSGTTWNPIIASKKSALLLGAADLLRFLPSAGFDGGVSLKAYAWNGTTGTDGSTADLSSRGSTGGLTAFSSSSLIGLLFVNRAPTVSATGVNLTGTPVTVANLLQLAGSADEGKHLGIALSGADGPGVWEYRQGKTPWQAVPAGATLLLSSKASLRFDATPNAQGTASLTYRAWDQTQGTAGQPFTIGATGDPTAFSTDSVTATLTGAGLGQPPAWVGGNPMLTPVLPGTAEPAGDTVADVFGPFFADTGKPMGIAVSGLTGTKDGTWQYSTDGGTTWTAFGKVTAKQPQRLAATDRIRFVPNASFLGAVTLTAFAWDGSAQSRGPLTATCLVNTAPTLTA